MTPDAINPHVTCKVAQEMEVDDHDSSVSMQIETLEPEKEKSATESKSTEVEGKESKSEHRADSVVRKNKTLQHYGFKGVARTPLKVKSNKKKPVKGSSEFATNYKVLQTPTSPTCRRKEPAAKQSQVGDRTTPVRIHPPEPHSASK